MKRILNACLMLPLLVTILLGNCHSQDNIHAKLDELRNSHHACDSTSFIESAIAAERLRNDRRLTAEQFVQMAKEPGTIILDARGKEAHQLLRIKGSVNLPYTSFSIENLKQIIPSTKTKVLIYCRNNIQTAPKKKAATEKLGHPYPIDLGWDLHLKARSFGLNIPTFITLYGYGFGNVWELDPVVDPNDSVIEFESSSSQKTDATAENVQAADQRK